jgi:hypothetical protein
MTKRVACVAENCGTFVLDDELYQKLKRTGEKFHCPEGHAQHFTESTEQKLRERIDELENKVQREKDRANRYRERVDEFHDDWREEKQRRQFVEQQLLQQSDGVVEVAAEQFKWACACGGYGQKAFDEEGDARAAYRKHQRRNCEVADEGVNTDA